MKNLFSRIVIAAAAGFASAAMAVDADVIARFSSVTNLTTCSQSVRNDLRAAVKASAAAGDFSTYDALLGLLKKNAGGKVSYGLFDIWKEAAWALAGFGDAQKKKKPAEQKEIIAGFREGGTTFGFWQSADGLEMKPDKAFLHAASAILTDQMPQEGLSADIQLRCANTLAWMHLKHGDKKSKGEAINRYRDTIIALQPVTMQDTNVVAGAVKPLLEVMCEMFLTEKFADVAVSLRENKGEFFNDRGMYNALILIEAAGYHRAGKMDKYRKTIEEFRSVPLTEITPDNISLFILAMTRRTASTKETWKNIAEVVDPLVRDSRKLLGPVERMKLAGSVMQISSGLGDMRAYQNAYREIENIYASIKKAWDDENEREALARAREKAAREKKEPFTPYVRDKSLINPQHVNYPSYERGNYIRTLIKNGLDEDAIPQLELFLHNRNPDSYLDLIKIYAKTGQADKAAELDAVVQGTNTTAKLSHKFTSAACVVYSRAKTPEELVAGLKALRPLSDADGKEGETQVDKDKRFFSKLRAFSRVLFSFGSDEKRYPYIKALEKMTYDMLWEEEPVRYEVRYMADAPATAEGAYAADLFRKLPVENRMAKYNVYSQFSRDAEMKRVKSAEKPHINADAEGREAALVLAYSDNGLHFYGRFNDPDAWKVRDGIAGAPGFEYSIMPGEDMPWHWNSFSTSGPRVDYGVVWDSPRKNFKVGTEYFLEDSVVKQDCHIVHVFFPWAAFPYQLPDNGDTWRFALVGGWAGQFGALGGGAVHELGRAMQIKFAVPPEVRAKLKLALLRQAVKDYKSVRSQFENAEFWVDPHLGDRPFYDAVVEPFIKELDGVADRVCKEELSASDVDSLLKDYLFDLSDFRLSLDAKRAAWLKDSLFK